MPVFPGVLVIEASAQAAIIFGAKVYGVEPGTSLLTGVQNYSIKRTSHPGDVLLFKVTLTKKKLGFYFFHSEVTNTDGEDIASLDFSCYHSLSKK